ncbi:uncharacterized protein LOC122264392 [Penaeus japonicus]|uniref:uncharacterized protein LOC122264392 n=1 Tax=Penaeus japonicus TaxID=27405 RepID=UPI001C710E0E|nr:uncharacterized protein LOC122264392 [Penaeus japonicus]
MKPHKDCNKYYECKDNVAYVKECGGDLVFNPALEQCDLPTNYECPKPIFCGCHCRYPVDGECNAYYDCRDSEAEKKYCTEGLLFNPDTRMCDIAENVDCPATTVTPPPTGCHDNVHDSDPDCKFWAANNDCHCKWTDGDCSWQHFVARACPRSCACQGHVNATSRPVIDFPCVDCSSGQQYWQHPSDCRKFIQCAPYGPQEMPCGEGTVWDQNLLTCNHEWATQCLTGNFFWLMEAARVALDALLHQPLTQVAAVARIQTASSGLPTETAPASQIPIVTGRTKWLECAPKPAAETVLTCQPPPQLTSASNALLTVVCSHTRRTAPSGFTATTSLPTSRTAPPICTSTQHLRYVIGQRKQVAPQARTVAVSSHLTPLAPPPILTPSAHANVATSSIRRIAHHTTTAM